LFNKKREYKVKVDEIEIDKTKLKWYNYFLSGVKGITDKFTTASLTGMNVCVYGQVPMGSGLSSSSALVVCAALTTLHANGLNLTRTELAEVCAASERHVGTQGGGMDQAISCLAEAGSAKLIDFNPLHVTNIALPQGSRFVITNSCVVSNKAAASHFNSRVAECRLSTQVRYFFSKLNHYISK
jgi:N-acetylgalactosamine kinase